MPTEQRHKKKAKQLMQFGTGLLCAIRKLNGTSQRSFAKMIGEEPSNLSAMEQGRRQPSLALFIAMADALGYEIRISIERKDQPNDHQ